MRKRTHICHLPIPSTSLWRRRPSIGHPSFPPVSVPTVPRGSSSGVPGRRIAPCPVSRRSWPWSRPWPTGSASGWVGSISPHRRPSWPNSWRRWPPRPISWWRWPPWPSPWWWWPSSPYRWSWLASVSFRRRGPSETMLRIVSPQLSTCM